MTDVLTMTPQGLYCPAGDFHIDPWRACARAVLTHGHADHARPGMGQYLCTDIAAPVIRHRLGRITVQTLPYGARLAIGGATVSLHPAGHVPGSAQVRVEVAGQVWVVSGDYKTTPDRLCDPFDPVPCHVFITECTFGLPLFRWQDDATLAGALNRWWAGLAAQGRPALIDAYSFGKAQRLMTMVDAGIGPILTHPAVEDVTAILRAQGLPLPPTTRLVPGMALPRGALVIAPPGAGPATDQPLARAAASGWMALAKRRGPGAGFVISDHADWDGLNAAISATGAARVLVTHGYTAPFRRWLEEGRGLHAQELETAFGSADSTSGGH